MDCERLGRRMSSPKLGEHSAELSAGLGYSAAEIVALCLSPPVDQD